MRNTLKIPVMLMVFAFLVLPKVSYAEDHHRHGFHAHANPDLTLVTGMDNIDNKVLIAAGPVPTADDEDQP